MGSPLGPILDSISLSHHEENWLNKCPIKFKPSFYRRYVDDIFVLFESSESADSFREYMSSKHQNINFTVEKENVGSLSFLHVKIYRKNGKFVISIYRKPTFSGIFTNYESFIPTYQKRGLFHTLLHRSFSICCDFKTFPFETDHLKTILIKNNYQLNFIDSCVKSFLNKLYTPEVVIPNVPKRNVFVKLPFLRSTSFQIRKKLQKLFSDKLTSCNLKIVFMSSVRVKSFSTFKDKLPKMLLSGLVYQYKCGGCNATYYGKTKRHFKGRICKHLGISHLTEKKVKIGNKKLTAIQEHLLCCNYSPFLDDFSILTRESNDFKLKIMESLLIELDKTILNKADSSLPLELFQCNISGYHMMFYHII